MRIVLRRLLLPVVIFLAWAPAAQAWSWPVQGAVLRPFAYDEGHPYDAGQHRGIDIASDAAGESVIAPAAGTVSFAGTVPTSGMCVTIQTPDGYSVTLTHLGSILVAKGLPVAEGDAVGTIGPSGTPEFDRPYLHLGIRTTSDSNGYLDPLGFLPTAPPGDPQTDTTSQPSARGQRFDRVPIRIDGLATVDHAPNRRPAQSASHENSWRPRERVPAGLSTFSGKREFRGGVVRVTCDERRAVVGAAGGATLSAALGCRPSSSDAAQRSGRAG